MRVLLIDIDTLRPDHLGCYGYGRNTSPNIDSIAADGVRFEEYYCPNAPCMPSRASLITGRYGIHTGIVGHGGSAADLWLEGADRKFRTSVSENNLISLFRNNGMHCVSVSSFPERHSAYWFHMGFHEMINSGGKGHESAEDVTPDALDWLDRKGKADNWLLHVNYWDPHTPYRAPASFGTPFENEPLPDNWINDAVLVEHKKHIGPHSVNEINMWNDKTDPQYPRQPGRLDDLDDVKRFIDNYDTGILYADTHVGYLLDKLRELGIYDDVSVIVTSDHGETMGELGIYGEHATADRAVCRIPMIIKWAGGQKGIVESSLHTNVDLAPTVAELLGQPVSERFDGISYAQTVLNGETQKREYAVLTQCAHVCQRSVRFDDYIYIRTYHGGYHMFNDEMLFDVKNDPHETRDLASERPELCARGARYLERWVADMMTTSDYPTDPLWVVMKEGGPYHARGKKERYMSRLERTGRGDMLPEFAKRYRDFE